MAAMISTTQAPTGGVAHAMNLPVEVPTRREGPAAIEPGEPARELDTEVTRLLRVRGGELAEPLLWQRPSHRRETEDVVAHLAPIHSRLALLSSWGRESHRSSAVRLAYAIVWLRLAQRRAGEFGPRAGRSARTRVLRARG
ncbi:MAG: hypothetical protein HYX55_06645 [Chloroflexi bacterium]|nr:hypothetical protein [Chloroflexota bacterium]